MTLPVVPGSSLSFSQINTELALSSTATISLNDAAVRTLAGVGASPATIAITNLSGKANEFSFTISSNQTNANLRTLAVNAGWNQTVKVNATIGSGIQISSTGTGTPALTVNGSFPGGVSLINTGVIVGRGGAGGRGGLNNVSGLQGGAPGSSGGTGLAVSVAVTITNGSGTISGGGGGGGGGGYGAICCVGLGQGGGGGGGNGFGDGGYAGDGPDSPGSPGSAGGQLSGGSGGGGGGFGAGSGGSGGSNASSGSQGGYSGTGGGGGAAITGNSNITYVSTGTRYGSIS